MALINPPIPELGQPNSTEDADIITALQELVNLVNGTLDAANLAAGAITEAKLASALKDLLIPAGEVRMYGANSAPTGWLLCDGSAVSRATESRLFGAIGTTFGVGDGTTTFNLPDFRGRVPVGKRSTLAMGENDGIAEASRSPNHTHSFSATSGAPSSTTVSKDGTGASTSFASTTHTHSVSGTSGFGGPAFLVVQFIIKK